MWPFPIAYSVGIITGGACTGLLGWASEHTLLTLTQLRRTDAAHRGGAPHLLSSSCAFGRASDRGFDNPTRVARGTGLRNEGDFALGSNQKYRGYDCRKRPVGTRARPTGFAAAWPGPYRR